MAGKANILANRQNPPRRHRGHGDGVENADGSLQPKDLISHEAAKITKCGMSGDDLPFVASCLCVSRF